MRRYWSRSILDITGLISTIFPLSSLGTVAALVQNMADVFMKKAPAGVYKGHTYYLLPAQFGKKLVIDNPFTRSVPS